MRPKWHTAFQSSHQSSIDSVNICFLHCVLSPLNFSFDVSQGERHQTLVRVRQGRHVRDSHCLRSDIQSTLVHAQYRDLSLDKARQQFDCLFLPQLQKQFAQLASIHNVVTHHAGFGAAPLVAIASWGSEAHATSILPSNPTAFSGTGSRLASLMPASIHIRIVVQIE